MDVSSIIVAVLAMIGTVVGSVMASNKTQAVIQVKIEDLTKKVEKHNNLIERMYSVEGRVTELEHDVRDLKARN